MAKTILITGSTDGIGLLCAQSLASMGHRILLHGRNPAKLEAAAASIDGEVESFVADLSKTGQIRLLVERIRRRHRKLDILINNAGILKSSQTLTADGLDIRFMVNTIAPYILTRGLLPVVPNDGRIINLSSAAQAPIDLDAMAGGRSLDDMAAYSQSKLAITIWSQELAKELPEGPVVVAVNPGSLLASKMVREGFGIAGNDISIGAEIICRAALDETFANASGKYFDNDTGRFASPNAAASNAEHVDLVMQNLRDVVARLDR